MAGSPAAEVPALVRRLRGGSAASQVATLRALVEAIKPGPEACKALVAAGGGRQAVKLLRSSSAKVQLRATWLLFMIGIVLADHKAAVAAAGAVPELLRLVQHATAGLPEVKDEIAAAAGIVAPAAVRLVDFTADRCRQLDAVVPALSEMAAHSAALRDAIPVLAELMLSSPTDEQLCGAAGTLNHLAMHSAQHAAEALAAGALPLLGTTKSLAAAAVAAVAGTAGDDSSGTAVSRP
ncbi:hypothetical protein ABPG75_002887 [Micractinium tetrahymenae]